MIDTIAHLILHYLQAASCIYGRMSLSKLYFIFSEHNPGLVTLDSFCRYAMHLQGPMEPFRIIGDDDIYRADISFADMDRWVVHRQYTTRRKPVSSDHRAKNSLESYPSHDPGNPVSVGPWAFDLDAQRSGTNLPCPFMGRTANCGRRCRGGTGSGRNRQSWKHSGCGVSFRRQRRIPNHI